MTYAWTYKDISIIRDHKKLIIHTPDYLSDEMVQELFARVVLMSKTGKTLNQLRQESERSNE